MSVEDFVQNRIHTCLLALRNEKYSLRGYFQHAHAGTRKRHKVSLKWVFGNTVQKMSQALSAILFSETPRAQGYDPNSLPKGMY